MKQHISLLLVLASTFPAHAALVIEPEHEPSYPSYSQAAPALYQSPIEQHSVNEQAKKLLAADAEKAMATPAKTPALSEKELGGNLSTNRLDLSGKGTRYRLDPTPTKPLEEVEIVVTETTETATQSDVVEVLPNVQTEPLPDWRAHAGSTLRETITSWSKKEGWDVRWESDSLDYPIEESFSMVGIYLDVLTNTFELYKDAKRPFKVEVYPSQKLVVVKEKK